MGQDYEDLGYNGHAYFLKTDAEMKSYGYKNWVAYYPSGVQTAPESATNAVNRIYTNVKGSMPYVNGYWYISQPDGVTSSITETLINGAESTQIETPFAVRYLQSDGTYLYYTDGVRIVRTTTDGSQTWTWIPEHLGNSKITEFGYKNGKLCLVYWDAVLDSDTYQTVNPAECTWSEYTKDSDDSGGTDSGDTGSGDTGNTGSDDTGNTGSGDTGNTGSGDTGNTGSGDTGNSNTGNTNTGNTETGNAGITETPENGEDKDEPEELIEGDEYTSGKITYEVTETESGKEVSVSAVDKNAKTVIIPGTVTINGEIYRVTSIEEDAFSENKILQSVKLGKNIEEVGSYAFSKCTRLKTVAFNNGVKIIEESAFQNCTSLKKVVLPSSVTLIKKNAFYRCKSLKKVQFKGKRCPTLEKNCFKRIDRKAIFSVPSAAKVKYKKSLTGKAGVTKTMKVR